MNRRRLASAVLAALVVLGTLGACSDGDDGDSAEPPPLEGEIEVTVDDARGCDFLDTKKCLFPFPNDFFTDRAETETGRQIDFEPSAMPANVDGVGIDPTEWNRNDGFSVGSPIITFVPGLDLEATDAAPVTDIGASLDGDAPIVLLDTETGERHPYWAELDSNVEPPTDSPLLVHPARNFVEGHRYVVAMRDLKDEGMRTIEATPEFRAYRDRLETSEAVVEDRRAHMESLFADLDDAGIGRDGLYLAWDFTVASAENLAGRMLHIRDDAFGALGDDSPTFTVDQVEEDVEPTIARRVTGTFQVPLYLTGDGSPGSRFNNGDDGLPARGATPFTASFVCVVPPSVLAPNGDVNPGRASLYGHGLLGSNSQVGSSYVRETADEHGFVFCGTNWIGMSEEDIPNALAILQELSRFPTLADRAQQGILNTLFLGRLMIHADGLVSDPAFQGAGGDAIIDTEELYFDGNSQGAIMGGAATAVAQDWTRAVLGVGAMNYSVLLNRSVDFDTYSAVLDPAYPEPLDRTLAIALIQMLWDRAETNGYAQHLTDDPYPDTPEHQILLQVAFGDHQVANVASDTMARTIGACAYQPALASGRSPDVEPLWGIEAIAELPSDECPAIVYFDSGSPPPPVTNTPPREGTDPHADPRNDPAAKQQKSSFLAPDGSVIDVCDSAPCRAAPS